jgi:hypothetical protein
MTQKEYEQARGTHKLKSTDRWISQNMEGIQVSKGHSQTEEHRQTDRQIDR